MGRFVPTEEQLFDYFIQEADPSIKKHIASYLADNPDVAKKYEDFAFIETAFSHVPTQGPSDKALQNVFANAKKHMNHSAKSSIWVTWFFWRKVLSYSFIFGFLAFLGIYLAQFRDNGINISHTNHKIDKNHVDLDITAAKQDENATDLVNDLVRRKVMKELNPQKIELSSPQSLYNKAVNLYQQGEYIQANQTFSEVLKADPFFPKKLELYTYWIKTLDEMGDIVKAQEKRDILQKLQNSDDTQ